MSDEAMKKFTVAAAALQFGVPERSLFRAVEKGHVPSTKRDGVTVLDPADVEAWVARREAAQAASTPAATATANQNPPPAAVMPGSVPAAHGGVAVGSRPSPRPVLDGDTTALLISAFKRGEDPVDVAERHRLPIPLVLEGHDLFLRAKSAATPSSQQATIEYLQMEVEMMRADINGFLTSITSLQASVKAIADRVANLPTPVDLQKYWTPPLQKHSPPLRIGVTFPTSPSSPPAVQTSA